ncbi:MAG: immunoglobulin domain-containing protein, partial [Vicinamibacterales bacterium]
MLVGSPSGVEAATASWNANPEPNIAGYILSYRAATPGVCVGGVPVGSATSLNVGSVTSVMVALTPGVQYFFVVRASNTSGLTSPCSTEVAFSVDSGAPTFTTQPISQTITAGQSTSFTGTASGTPAPTYQWQISTNSGTTWTNLTNTAPYSGVTTGALSVMGATTGLNGARYRAVASSTAGNVPSTAATLTVNAGAVPIIATQPMSQTVTAGAAVSFTVVASGTPAPTYQWQVSTNGGTSFSNLANAAPYSGVATTTLTVTSATTGLSGAQYRAVAANSAGTATSSAAVLTVTAAAGAPAITTQPTDQTVTVGTNASFTVVASGTPVPAYQWQVSTNGGASFANLTNAAPYGGVTTGTLTLTNVTTGTGRYYRAVAINSAGSATSTAALLGIRAVGSSLALVQHAQLATPTVVTTAAQAFATTNTAGNFLAVIVRASAAGEVFTVTDARGNLYQQATQVSSTTNGHTVSLYYAQNITGGANTVTVTQTVPATLHMALLEYAGVLASGALDVAQSATGNNATPNTGSATGTTNNALVIGVIVPTNGRTITVGSAYTARETVLAAPNTRLLVEDSLLWGAGGLSASATLSTADTWTAALAIFKGTTGASGTAPTITTQPASQTVTAGANASFTVGASGTPVPTYQWQVSTNGGTSFSNLANAAPYSGVATAT